MYINIKGNTSKCPLNHIILTLFLQKLYPLENDKLELNLLKDISDIIKLFESKAPDKFKYIYFNEKKITGIKPGYFFLICISKLTQIFLILFSCSLFFISLKT